MSNQSQDFAMDSFNDAIDTFIDQHYLEALEHLKTLLNYRSVESAPEGAYPFGAAVGKCLDNALDLCKQYGFETYNYDNYAGYAELGTGSEMIGVLAHLDIVPEGDPSTWSHDPFGGEIHEGKLYGRGTLDDKGPAVAAIFAMLAVQAAGVPLNKRLRLIFGTNEETGSACMKYYRENGGEIPTLGFTPDADFPVIHGEKGLMILNLIQKNNKRNPQDLILKIEGGNAANMVPDVASANLSLQTLHALFPEITGDIGTSLHIDSLKTCLTQYSKGQSGIEWHVTPSFATLVVHGVSAHGSTPELGLNAISKLMDHLYGLMKPLYETKSPEQGTLDALVHFYNETIGMDYDGKKFGIGLSDSVSGDLVFNVGIVHTPENEPATLVINIRYPITSAASDVFEGIEAQCIQHGFAYETTSHKDPLYVPIDTPLVQRLLSVYNDYYHTEEQPITIAGGTYAREIPNIVAFGPLNPGQVDTMHQKDEFIDLVHFMDLSKLYARALVALLDA